MGEETTELVRNRAENAACAIIFVYLSKFLIEGRGGGVYAV